jgi:nifR3 family TIM-barrel protein
MSSTGGFWKSTAKPIMVLAPMADVTDAAFRRIIAKYGKPDVIWTEFVSVAGLCSDGKEKLLADLRYTEEERPIVAQIFGNDPGQFRDVSAMLTEMGFDGIDINMGCPDRSVEKQGGGASLIKDPIRAQRILEATIDGAEWNGKRIPVSVKTRIGYNKPELETWLPYLLEVQPAALTLHARTRKEMSKVPARWEQVREAVTIRDRMSPETLIIGNGDVIDVDDAVRKVTFSGADGAMIGRGIFGNPWLFARERRYEDIPIGEKLGVMIEHTKLFEELMQGVKSFAVMKKHYKAYAHGFDGAKELRMRLMDASDAAEVERITLEWLANSTRNKV